jgi:hypothetical protein
MRCKFNLYFRPRMWWILSSSVHCWRTVIHSNYNEFLTANKLHNGRAGSFSVLYSVQGKLWIWLLFNDSVYWLYSVDRRRINDYGALVGWRRQGKAKVLGERSVPVLRCPPQVPNICSEVWETNQVSHGTGKQTLSYNGILETKGAINFKKTESG